jgi:hypothetical protein
MMGRKGSLGENKIRGNASYDVTNGAVKLAGDVSSETMHRR